MQKKACYEVYIVSVIVVSGVLLAGCSGKTGNVNAADESTRAIVQNEIGSSVESDNEETNTSSGIVQNEDVMEKAQKQFCDLVPYYLYSTPADYLETLKNFDTLEIYNRYVSEGKEVFALDDVIASQMFPDYYAEEYASYDCSKIGSHMSASDESAVLVAYYESILAGYFSELEEKQKDAVADKAHELYMNEDYASLMEHCGGPVFYFIAKDAYDKGDTGSWDYLCKKYPEDCASFSDSGE